MSKNSTRDFLKRNNIKRKKLPNIKQISECAYKKRIYFFSPNGGYAINDEYVSCYLEKLDSFDLSRNSSDAIFTSIVLSYRDELDFLYTFHILDDEEFENYVSKTNENEYSLKETYVVYDRYRKKQSDYKYIIVYLYIEKQSHRVIPEPKGIVRIKKF